MIDYLKKYSWLLIVFLLLVACQPNKRKSETEKRPVLMVTIEPLRYFTEAIAGSRFTVESIVPRGSSPETYDPTPAQLLALADSRAYLRIGPIGFEQVWMDRLMANAPDLPVFNTSQGIDFILEDEGPEPHVWTSAVNARVIADNIATALCALDSTHTAEYLHRRDSLMTVIAHTDRPFPVVASRCRPHFPHLPSGTQLFRPRLRSAPTPHRGSRQRTHPRTTESPP